MNIIKKIKNNPKVISNHLIWYLNKINFFNNWSDEKYLKFFYKYHFGKDLDLENPKLYSEKLQWLKINDRKNIYTKMVDKYEAKKFIASKVGDEYNIPTLGIYDKFCDINFDDLPDKFIIKCTHDSGTSTICKNKKELNLKSEAKKFTKAMKKNYYYSGREWPYKNVKPRIIIETLLENDDKTDIVEYNIFCLNGVPRLIMTCLGDKRVKRYNNYYDINFKKLNLKCHYDTLDIHEEKPKQFNEMIKLSKILSSDIPSLRVDFYLCNGRIYLGELTFFHWAGFTTFEPSEWDKKLGDWLQLNK